MTPPSNTKIVTVFDCTPRRNHCKTTTVTRKHYIAATMVDSTEQDDELEELMSQEGFYFESLI